MKKIMIPSFIIITGCITLPSGPRIGPFDEIVLHEGGDSKILVVDISGIMIDTKQSNVFGARTQMNITSRVREQLDKAREDEDIKAVILKIDSPGGAVTTADILHHEIIKYKKETGMYIVAQMESVAASGGYYVAVAADEIIAHPTTITGSIGVIITMVNIHGLMEKIGIENQTITSGDSKAMGSFLKKMDAEEKKLFQDIVDSLYERFLSVILDGRENLEEKELKKVADGRILLAKDALEAGLIDHIGYWDDTIALTEKKSGITDPTVITYRRPGDYSPNIYSSTPVSGNSGGINILPVDTSMFYNKYGLSFMYLWKP